MSWPNTAHHSETNITTSALHILVNLIGQIDPEGIYPGHPRSEIMEVVQTFHHFVHERVGWRSFTASDDFVSGSTVRRWLGRWFANGLPMRVTTAPSIAMSAGTRENQCLRDSGCRTFIPAGWSIGWRDGEAMGFGV